MFGRKGLPKLDGEAVERLALAYLTALDEIEGLVDTLKQRSQEADGQDREHIERQRQLLVRYHTRILTVAKSLPPPDGDLLALAGEAEAMEEDIAQIAEAQWGEDEARVSGLIMAAEVLRSNG